MKIGKCFITFAIALVIGCIRLQCDAFASENRVERRQTLPNFITLVIDDMGYSDISAFGGEVPTPNMDELASDGIMLTDFYAAATSSPSRSMLFTGKDNHDVGFGAMGPEAALPTDTPIFPELLKEGGYHTMMTGKWHLGEQPENYPYNRGFAETRGLLLAGGDLQYLSDENGNNITSYMPSKLENLGRETYYNENGVELKEFPPNAYSTDYYTDMAIEMLKDRDTEKPFYLNISHIATHSPWQAPADIIAKYIDVYARGWDVLRAERFERQKELGIVAQDAEMPPRPDDLKPWDSLTADEQRLEAKRMAVYAAMIEVLDDSVGRLVSFLKEIGEYENTVFFVYSDNGADRHTTVLIDLTFPPAQYTMEKFLTEYSENKEEFYERMGGPDTYLGPTHEWAWLSNTPLTGYKEGTFEGGVRTMSFVHYPESQVRGVMNDCILSVMDISATILDMAGIQYPETFKGKPIDPPFNFSWAGLFDDTMQCNPEWMVGFGVEVFGETSIGLRKGDWKLSQDMGEEEMHFYNLKEDPFEQNDLSRNNPEKFHEMMIYFNKYKARWGSDEDDAPYLDTSFGDGGKITMDLGSKYDSGAYIGIQPDGKIIIAGESHEDYLVMRYDSNGNLDPSFGYSGWVTTDISNAHDSLRGIAIQPDGKIVVGGYAGDSDFAVVRYDSSGNLDASFGDGGKVVTDIGSTDLAYDTVLHSDGRIVLVGKSDVNGADTDFAVVCYDSNGNLDPAFGNGGIVTTDIGTGSIDSARGAAFQPDGKIVVVGETAATGDSDTDFIIVRYNSNGELDTTFGNGGKIIADIGTGTGDQAAKPHILADGKIIVRGTSDQDFAIVRYDSSGNLDTAFGDRGIVITDIGDGTDDLNFTGEILPNGKIIAGGTSGMFTTDVKYTVVRYTENGELDTAFGDSGKVVTPMGTTADVFGHGLAIQPDGKIVFTGTVEGEVAVLRYISAIPFSATVTGSDFTIAFSRPMDQLTINKDTITVRVTLPGIGYGTLAGYIELDETTAMFIPYEDFITGLSYSVTIEGAKDAEGNPLEPGEWSFTGGDETDL
ncbi:MAG: sulfatase-like hydrolase/transferase [Desulfobacteraceae bacterium]|nr:sulfatase-like hydrolase/transferase [Desulfobacteraceae bacterium]